MPKVTPAMKSLEKNRLSTNTINALAQHRIKNLENDRQENCTQLKKVCLTRREREVLLLVAEGDSSKNVAKTMFLSKRTVDFHLSNAFVKLGVENRLQAILKANRLNLLDMSEN